MTILPLSGVLVYLEFNSNDDAKIESKYAKLREDYESYSQIMTKLKSRTKIF